MKPTIGQLRECLEVMEKYADVAYSPTCTKTQELYIGHVPLEDMEDADIGALIRNGCKLDTDGHSWYLNM